MAKQASLYLPKGANNQSIALTSADTTVATLCFTAGADDSDVKAIIVTTNDTTLINLQLFIVRSAVNYLLGTIRIAVLSGTDGASVGVDLLNSVGMTGLPLDAVGKRYIPMKTGDTLKVACVATMTAAKTCWVSVLGQDY